MAFDEGIDQEIDLYGESVTLRSITEDSYNDRGDLNESGTPSDTGTIAIPNILSNNDLEVAEGKFQNGDKRFFFKTTESVSNRNRIYHDGKWYEAEDVLKHRLRGEVAAIEVIARKI